MGLIGSDGQDKLAKIRVLCIGIGGLGTLVSSYLAAAGVGAITLVDGDKVELSNLHRQISYNETDCSEFKAITQAKVLQKLNSNCTVTAYNFFIEQYHVVELISQHDLILDCSDNFSTRYLIGDISVLSEKPVISASIDGFTGQIIVLLQDVCYRCVFPKTDNKSVNCFDGAVIGPAVGIIASIQANEAIKYITHISRESRLIQVDSLKNKISNFNLKADPACINNHEDILSDGNVRYMSFSEVMVLDKKQQVHIIDLGAHVIPGDISVWETGIHASKETDKPIVVICNHGYKSRLIAYQLASIYKCCIYYSSISKL